MKGLIFKHAKLQRTEDPLPNNADIQLEYVPHSDPLNSNEEDNHENNFIHIDL